MFVQLLQSFTLRVVALADVLIRKVRRRKKMAYQVYRVWDTIEGGRRFTPTNSSTPKEFHRPPMTHAPKPIVGFILNLLLPLPHAAPHAARRPRLATDAPSTRKEVSIGEYDVAVG